MKSYALILSFLPLVAFSVLARWLPDGSIGVAALVAACLALIALLVARPALPPKIINVVSLVLFAVFAALGFSLGRQDDSWMATWGGAGVGIVLGLVILALVPVLPFTEQFAREEVPRSDWHSPTFKKINRVLSTAWGLAIVALGLSRVVAAALDQSHAAEVIFGLVIPIVIIVRMIKFSASYPDSVTRGQSTTRS
ncbi:hypothetical protein EES43_00170 [Streptomyces sp. ADI96-02]|uniref:hypothetical protein n=1 Tax=unclassified Streptomyces TaxID=2593676 RepID=UPI000F55163B|nr:hypothetical protein [Streptomyces sp. ADI96-02]RPK69217.1 hypothetical protein EES43_00170 [Streptomyces sp. ADI96-02]